MVNFVKKESETHGHPSNDELLLLADGELSSKDSSRLRQHLEACWSCRVRLQKVEDTISAFVDYRNIVLTSFNEQPPHGWSNFTRRLNELSNVMGRRPWASSLTAVLSRFFLRTKSFRWSSLSGQTLVRITAGTVALVLIVGLFLLRSESVPTVTATELLNNASEAQKRALQTTPEAVIYQKLSLRLRNKGVESDSVGWEFWSDTTSSKFRQMISNSATGGSGANLVANLIGILKANHMNSRMPLSADSFRAWREQLQHSADEISQSRLGNGTQTFELKTTVTGAPEVGALREATLVVRASDWHPIEQRLVVAGQEGIEEWKITELSYAVVSLRALGPEIFAAVVDSRSNPEKPAQELAPEPAKDSPESPAAVTNLTATTELEITALQLLNSVDADVDEQVSVYRTSDGLLHIKGVVETEQRREAIRNALSPIAHNPAVRIDVETVAEVARREAQANKPVTPVTVDRVEVDRGSMPLEPDLRQYFSTRNVADLDAEVSRFASAAINRSQRAVFHATALARLSERFSADQIAALDVETKSKWLEIVRRHARAIQSETARLHRDLQRVFPESSSVDRFAQFEVTQPSDLIRAIDRLRQLTIRNDQIVRSAFTISAEKSAAPAFRTTQFWTSLSEVEYLASKIGGVRPE